MSDWVELDGRKYYEESYLLLANNNSERRGETIKELERQLDDVRKKAEGFADTLRAICVKGLGLTDPYENLAKPDVVPDDWKDGLISDKVLAIRTQLEKSREAWSVIRDYAQAQLKEWEGKNADRYWQANRFLETIKSVEHAWCEVPLAKTSDASLVTIQFTRDQLNRLIDLAAPSYDLQQLLKRG